MTNDQWSEEIQWATLCSAFRLRDRINKQIESGFVRQPRRGVYQYKKVKGVTEPMAPE